MKRIKFLFLGLFLIIGLVGVIIYAQAAPPITVGADGDYPTVAAAVAAAPSTAVIFIQNNYDDAVIEDFVELDEPTVPEVQLIDLEGEALKEFVERFKKLPIDGDWKSVRFMAYGNIVTSELALRTRAGLVEDFYNVYNYLPEIGEDWNNLMNIYYGIPPVVINEREDFAAGEFTRIYERIINFAIPEEKRFVDMVAYFLRPTERNLEYEKNALVRYTQVYNSLPGSGQAWSILRAIAYSLVK